MAVKKLILSFALIPALLLLNGCKIGHKTTFEPGSGAPGFSLPVINGEGERSLESFKGKIVLLTFMASWCGNCIGELPELEALHKKLGDSGLAVVAIGIKDTPERLKALVAANNITFPVLFDNSDLVSDIYKTTGVPETFILDRDGNFVMFLDPDTNDGVVRVMGPRSWGSEMTLRRVSALLG